MAQVDILDVWSSMTKLKAADVPTNDGQTRPTSFETFQHLYESKRKKKQTKKKKQETNNSPFQFMQIGFFLFAYFLLPAFLLFRSLFSSKKHDNFFVLSRRRKRRRKRRWEVFGKMKKEGWDGWRMINRKKEGGMQQENNVNNYWNDEKWKMNTKGEEKEEE